ncbi:MAG: ABC transporter ATP-binding protein [Thermoleophilia bacterium]
MGVDVTSESRRPPVGTGDALLEVTGLTTTIRRRRGSFAAVDDVSFTVGRGEILGMVGESGCGKTMTVLSLMGLLPAAATVTAGRASLEGREILGLPEREMRTVRGRDLAMVFQEPMTSLDPSFSIGYQMSEVVRAHGAGSRKQARQRAIEMLGRVGIPRAEQRIDDYPHQFSGGMRQRVMIATALLLEPKVLIADEPTTALDVTIQAQILDLLASLRDDLGMSVILITHNLSVVNEIADRVAVMYAGQIVELATVRELFDDPRHPYTQGLLRSMPDLTVPGERLPVILGRVPDLGSLPPGCRFAPRCPNRIGPCDERAPALERDAAGRSLRCYNPTPFRADG